MRNLFVWLPLLMFFPGLAWGQKVDPAQASPKAVVQATFKALYDSDFDRVVALTDPKAKKEYSNFLMELFEYDPQSYMVTQLKEQMHPIDTKEEVRQAGPDAVLKQKYENIFKGITKEELRENSPKLEILGVIVESDDRAHAITRTGSSHVVVETCQKSDGKWYKVSDDELPRLFRRMKAIHEKHDPESEAIGPEFEFLSAKVLGYVRDGKDRVHALCRIRYRSSGSEDEDMILHPINRGELSWDHLEDKDQTELIAALRKQWER